MKDKQNRRRLQSLCSRLSLAWGAGILILLPAGAIAQTTSGADEAVWGNNTSDPLNGQGGASSLMNILQRSQVGPNQSRAEFLEKQNENLNDAAAAFRARQIDALKSSQPAQMNPNPVAPVGRPLQ